MTRPISGYGEAIRKGLDEITFWAGQKLATYQVGFSGTVVSFAMTSTNVYFGSKLISKGSYNVTGSGDYVTLAAVAADRLGSIGKFYPYGVERPSATANNKEKFTGYFRDAATGLDYADQRYEQPGMGRFMTPDFKANANASDPEAGIDMCMLVETRLITVIPLDRSQSRSTAAQK